jgi:carboxymethylenebutenolidase
MAAHKDPSQFARRQTMTARWSEARVDDAAMPLYVCTPDREIFGDVIVLMEAFGLTDHVQDICGRLAQEGFRAIAPDLYHFIEGRRVFTQDTVAEAIAATRLLDDTRMLKMVNAAIAWREQPQLPLFLFGLCMGGRLAWAVASERHAFDAVVCFYGPGIDALQATPQCPVFLAYGEQDPLIPGSERLRVRERLEQAGVPHRLQIYLNAGHGFLCSERDGYARDAATNAFSDATTFMRETVLMRSC